MKKFVVLSLISFLILVFGATVYGQEKGPVLEFKASGFLDVISEYTRNVYQAGSGTSATGGTGPVNSVFAFPDATGGAYMLPGAQRAFNEEQAYMESRGRLRFDAIMGKELMGTFGFEFDSTRWGERAPAGAQRNFAGHWGVADRSAMELKHMYITFGMPWIPIQTTIQAGIQPIGIRPSVFLSTDGPGITAAFKVDPVNIKFVWGKILENKDWAADDADMYALEVNAKIQALTIGLYGVNFNMNSYPVADGEPTSSSNMFWAGAYMDGKLGPVLLNFDFIYDWGKTEDRRDAAARFGDVDFSGWGAVLNVGFPWEKFLFGFASIYGTGSDADETSASANPGTAVASGSGRITKDVSGYVVPAGTEGGVGHSLIMSGNGINRMNTGLFPAAATQHALAPFGGKWINKLYGSFRVSPIFTTRLEVMYILDTSDNGNTIGTAIENPSAGVARLRDDDTIGWEIDWLNTLQLYRNLTFQFGFGYLFAGNAMEYRDGTTLTNAKPKDPYVLTTNLTYSF